MDTRAIGVFDSGLGGLTVVKEITKVLPNEDIIYLGDTARVPYGTRGVETIKKFSEENIRFLLDKNVKCIVVACHTSSAVAGKFLRNKFKRVPVFDVVSSVLNDLKDDQGEIGVIGTRATVGNGVYSKFKKVVQKPCPLFVPFIEEGEVSGDLINKLAEKYLKGMKVDKLVLACTHYPIIQGVIRKQVGKKVQLVNPGITLAQDLKKYLTSKSLLKITKKSGKREYFVTDLNDRFVKVAEMFLGHKIESNLKKVAL